jgi:hypothetical protein
MFNAILMNVVAPSVPWLNLVLGLGLGAKALLLADEGQGQVWVDRGEVCVVQRGGAAAASGPLRHVEQQRSGTVRLFSNIDCLMARTACLVCLISSVNGHSKKKKKKRLKMWL